MTKKISALSRWLGRKAPLWDFLHENRVPNRELGVFIGIDISVNLHETVDLPAESLLESWRRASDYVSGALSIIKADEPDWLDKEDVYDIESELGGAPPTCYPMYFISVAADDKERLVYVGKTSSENSRFKGGHAAITKLHASQYDGLQKKLYLATIFCLDDLGYLPLEWIKPFEKSNALLESLEAQLIFDFKPELNSDHVDRYNSRWPTPIFIENHCGVSSFLNGTQSYGPAGTGRMPYIWSPEEELAAPKRGAGSWG